MSCFELPIAEKHETPPPFCQTVVQINLPEHELPTAHETVCNEAPAQPSPDVEGAGFVHVRVRLLVPIPQETEHGDHDVQSDQLPSTIKPEEEEIENCVIKCILREGNIFHHITTLVSNVV